MNIKKKIAQVGILKLFTVMVICMMSFSIVFVMAGGIPHEKKPMNILDTKTKTGNLKFTDTNEMTSDFLDNSFLKIKYDNDNTLATKEIKNPKYSKIDETDVFTSKTDKLETEFYKIEQEKIETDSIRYINRSAINGTEMMTSYTMFEYSDSVPTISSYIPNEGYVFYGYGNYFRDLKIENEYDAIRYKTEGTSSCPVIISDGNAVVIEFHKEGLTKDDVDKFYTAIQKAVNDYGITKIKESDFYASNHLIYYMDGLNLKQIGRLARDGDTIIFFMYLEKPDENMFDNLTISTKIKQDWITDIGGLKDLNENIDFSIKEKIVEYFLDEEGYTSYSDGFTPKEEEIKSLLSYEMVKEEWLLDAQWGSPFIESEKESYEFSVILNEKPETNIVEFDIETEGLNFYYQPELTQEQRLNSFRPSNVVGSYAVYYDGSKRDNEYKTGKVMHIYRPKIIDAENNWQWADLDINEVTGKLTITINQSFLDNAIYPVLVDPTFGYTTFGDSSAGLDGKIGGTVFTGVDGTVDSITFAAGDTLGSGKNSTCAIYENDSETTISLLTNGETESHDTPDTYTWTTFNFSTSPTISSTKTYALIMAPPTGDKVAIRYDDNGNGVGADGSYGDGGFPSSLNITRDTKTYSIYANYTESSGDTTPPTNPNLIILYPTNDLSISGSSAIPLNFSANDTNIDTCFYNLKKSDGTFEITDFAINCSENTTFDVSIYDTFTLNFTVNDTAGNSNSSQINFTVTQPDSSAPPSEGTGNDGTGSGGTSTFNKTLVCEFAEQFLREHITIVGFDYSHDDIVNLTDLINVYSRPNIQISTTELYLKNFELQCNRTNPEFLKIEEPSNFTFITVHAANLTCNGQINKKAELNLGLFTMKFDMDWYIPFLKIDTGEMTCASLNFWSWIFKYENNGDDFYSFAGFKIWWILSLGILILLWWIFIGRFRQNKKINKLIDRKLKT